VCLTIPAGVKHLCAALEDNTILACIHNTGRKESVEILEEHAIV
jgi:quercetin dioxygenase-like cupin family protein